MASAFNPDLCFPPVVGRDAEILVLGSLPGRKSLEMQQYYAHPQNAFWKLIARIFETESSLPYKQRLQILTSHGVALWDVLAAAERPGSLDSAIVRESAQVNDFAKFFSAHPRIRRVYFNGRKAEDIYRRQVLGKLGPEDGGISYLCLPSTSPAHAGMTFAEKLGKWRILKERAT